MRQVVKLTPGAGIQGTGPDAFRPVAAKGAGDHPADPPAIHPLVKSIETPISGGRANPQIVRPVPAGLTAAFGKLPAIDVMKVAF